MNEIDPELSLSAVKIRGKQARQLYYFQEEAIGNWIKNGKIGYFEMATGTGKTFTAINALKIVLEDGQNNCVIIAV
ncbi:MAG: DEAD/DEAH box helicase family protein, partial [candidate division Zixibacteria bacterium]|nr:DEAD/DEAH box helicase family protein [candidate division Zixibacteria bacterium]